MKKTSRSTKSSEPSLLGGEEQVSEASTSNVVDSNGVLRSIELYTDGACSGNPGPGGWAYVLRDGPTGKEREESGGQSETTNNQMELTAVIRGLKALKRPCRVALYSDSQYVLQGMESWMKGWKKKNWKKSGGPIKNLELWKQLDELASIHRIAYHHVRGHAGHPENERCDQLAVQAAEKYR
jgi:ribonuclease HI